MASFSRSAVNALGTGYDLASPKKDKNDKTAYQRYVEKYYGPGVQSHNDPIAIARAATGAVAQGLKSGAGFLGAGFLGHAAAGLLGAPMGSSQQGVRAPANTGGGIGSDAAAAGRDMPSNRLYGNSAIGAGLGSAGGSGSGYGNTNDIGSRIFGDLQRDFGLSANQAAGIVGNLGHESGGFTQYQERNPTKGRGGAGWAQWTGDRRVAFESYAKQNNFHPQSYEANYGFLKNELSGKYKGAIDAVKKANTVQDAVYKFEQTYEKANPKYVNYASRNKYANSIAAGAPTTALAYTSTDQAQTPAQQAAAEQASGRATSSRYERSPEIAQMQRDLNSRGAKLTVDGIRGPLTQAAEKQFLGSPTSVRTPSFTSTPTTPANNWSSLQQAGGRSPTRTVNQRQDYVPTPGFTNRQSYTSGRGDEGSIPRAGVAPTPAIHQPYSPAVTPRTPYLNQPYTPSQSSYTSGRGDEGRGVPAPLASIPRRVPTESIIGPAMPLRPFQPAETARIPQSRPPQAPQTPSMNQPYTGPEWDVLPGPVVPATPYLHQPYTMTTGGANAIVAPTQAARLPRARPDYQPPQQAVPTLIERLDNLVERAERALSGSRGSNSRSSDSRSGSGGGGNYSGGNYGGQGGSRISEGVGGSFKNR